MYQESIEVTSERSSGAEASDGRRRRGWWWFWGLLIGVPVLLVAVAYAVLAYQYYSQSVRITKNYAAELNAPILAVPEEKRAWTHYRRALEMLERQPAVEKGEFAYAPGEVNWEFTIEYLRRNRRALDAVRKAAMMRPMGCLFQDAPAREDIEWRMRHGETTAADVAVAGSPSENPQLADTLATTQMFRLLSLSKLLSADARLAAIEHDGNRVVANIIVLLDMGVQIRERSFLVDQMVGATVRDSGFDLAFSILARQDSVLDDGQLAALAKRLEAEYKLGPVRFSLVGERVFFLDSMQRTFTDDGLGDGWITPGALAEYSSEPGLHRLPGIVSWLPAPLAARVIGRRRQAEDKHEVYYQEAKNVMQLPLWQRSAMSEIFDIDPDLVEPRNWLVASSVCFWDTVLTLAEQETQRRDALMVAVTLVRHYRKHSQWPRSLSELAPELLRAVPPDRFDGRPLRYAVVGGRPVLYSVGADLDDDGGMPLERDGDMRVDSWPPDPSIDGDWVLWPLVEEKSVTLVMGSGGDEASQATEYEPRRPPEPPIDDSDIELNDARVEAPENVAEPCR